MRRTTSSTTGSTAAPRIAITTPRRSSRALDVDVAELISGTNKIEFATTKVPTGGYMPTVYNIDLLVAK